MLDLRDRKEYFKTYNQSHRKQRAKQRKVKRHFLGINTRWNMRVTPEERVLNHR
jgi:hypothetical protein